MSTKLTKSFTTSDWVDIRTGLRDRGNPPENWKTAVSLLRERIRERYLEPLQHLINDSRGSGEGFTIVTIEFLATIEEGRIFKYDKEPNDSHYYYKESARIFQRFLKTASPLREYFGAGAVATTHDFYLNVRCALIHEAQTRNNWEIKIFKNIRDDKASQICLQLQGDGTKVIYRTALFNALKQYFYDLTDVQIIQRTDRGRTLRKHLARKIDHIAEIEPDGKFWWT